MQGDWVPILRLIPVGEKLLGNLLQAGWIERSPDLKTADLYRITEAGRVAFRTPVPIR
jgi:DNA-binding MarR family transcriptional regulator